MIDYRLCERLKVSGRPITNYELRITNGSLLKVAVRSQYSLLVESGELKIRTSSFIITLKPTHLRCVLCV